MLDDDLLFAAIEKEVFDENLLPDEIIKKHSITRDDFNEIFKVITKSREVSFEKYETKVKQLKNLNQDIKISEKRVEELEHLCRFFSEERREQIKNLNDFLTDKQYEKSMLETFLKKLNEEVKSLLEQREELIKLSIISLRSMPPDKFNNLFLDGNEFEFEDWGGEKLYCPDYKRTPFGHGFYREEKSKKLYNILVDAFNELIAMRVYEVNEHFFDEEISKIETEIIIPDLKARVQEAISSIQRKIIEDFGVLSDNRISSSQWKIEREKKRKYEYVSIFEGTKRFSFYNIQHPMS